MLGACVKLFSWIGRNMFPLDNDMITMTNLGSLTDLLTQIFGG